MKPRLRRLLEWLGEHTPIKIAPVHGYSARLQTLAGLDALGPDAEGALPTLESMLNQKPPDPDVVYVIARIGEAGVPLLTKSRTNTTSAESKVVRHGAGVCLDDEVAFENLVSRRKN